MRKKLLYNKPVKALLRLFFGLFYGRKYLRGYYFDTKRYGWVWALRGIKGRLAGDNRRIPWPVNPRTIISNAKNIHFHVDDIHVFQTPGCYWQNLAADIVVGRGCYVAPNVGIITTNHDVYDIQKHAEGKPVILGDYVWIGMNAVILPGVELGPHTIVGAGSVVTRGFPQGYCVVGGNPAKVIKELDKSRFANTTEN